MLRTTFTSDMSFTVSSRCAAQASKSGCSRPSGFSMQATAPASIASNATTTSFVLEAALHTMMGSGVVSMMRRVASNPSTRGMLMSMSTTSGRSARTKSIAAWPSATSPTTRMRGSDSSRCTRNIRDTFESSATSTLIRVSAMALR